jgi:hypothetical protein
MTHTWTLSMSRLRLAVRNRIFIFFSLVMPLGFLFLYMVAFAQGNLRAVPYLLGAVLGLTVMGSFWGPAFNS